MQNKKINNLKNENNSAFCNMHSALKECCVCRKRQAVDKLIRVARVKTADGFKYFIDTKGNANGRGAHLCPACIERAIKTKALNRSFKGNVGNEIYEQLANNVGRQLQ